MSLMNKHHPVKAVTFALSAALFLTGMNTLAKMAGTTHNAIDITAWRNAGSLILLVAGLFIIRKRELFHTNHLKLQIWRAVIGTIGMALSVWAFILLPLASVIAIGFLAPIIASIIAVFILRERIGIFRIAAIGVGFFGALIVMNAQIEMNIGWLGICVACGFVCANACVMVTLRALSRVGENSLTTNVYFMGVGLFIILPFLPLSAIAPNMDTLPILMGMGVVGLASLLLKTEAYQWGPVSLVSPISYTMIIWAAIMDWFVFDIMIGWPTVIGGAIIIAANIFIVHRERHRPSQ